MAAPRLVGAAGTAVALALVCACASAGGGAFAPASPDKASRAVAIWQSAVERAEAEGDVNALYDASLSQGLRRTGGTLAVRFRGDTADGTLAGPFGSPIARYDHGELSGEKLEPVALPPEELRGFLSGVWPAPAPAVVGERGGEVLLRWPGKQTVEGVFDVGRGELLSLRVARAEGDLEAKFSGTRDPWPSGIEIEEKRSGSKLRLKLLSRERVP